MYTNTQFKPQPIDTQIGQLLAFIVLFEKKVLPFIISRSNNSESN